MSHSNKPGARGPTLAIVIGLFLATGVAACYLALDDRGAEHPLPSRTEAVEHAPASEDPSAVEEQAIALAAQPLERQSRATQEQYFEGWIAALERTQALQREQHARLVEVAASAELDEAQREALDARIAESGQRVEDQGRKLNAYRERLSKLQM